jgi:hypothetical protein
MELSYYKKNRIKENLRHFYNIASDEDRIKGKQWYVKANLYCEELAVKYGYNKTTVAAVLSQLSPRNKWERNLIDTETVLSAIKEGLGPEDVKVCTFNSNKVKAFKIAKLEETINIESPKTFSFLQNIAHLDERYVTVDIWHTRAAFNKMIPPKYLSTNLYNELQKITIQEAKELGLKGYEYQAIIWETIKNS